MDLFSKMKAHLEDPVEGENSIPHMYLDSEGYVTVGIGHLIPDENAARALTFYYRIDQKEVKGGVEIVTAKKEDVAPGWAKGAEYRFVKAKAITKEERKKGKHNVLWTHFQYRTDLYLRAKEIEKLLKDDLDSVQKELEKKFSGYKDFPEPAKLALLDMEFNMGRRFNKTKWNQLFEALEEEPKDWNAAKVQCNRPQVAKERNDWTKKKFQEAADSKEVKTNPEPLNRPRTDSLDLKKKSTTPTPLTRPRSVPPR